MGFLQQGHAGSMRQIFVAEEHDQVYDIWNKQGVRNLKVAHIDFHCDMRGLMIDRSRGRAFMASKHEASFVDPGNYLGHAIMNGIVTDLRWVHGPRGGRRFDSGAVVNYETDFAAPWHRWRHGRSGGHEAPLAFRQQLLDDWEGVRPGEHLDIDWDALASVEYDADHTRDLITSFLNREFTIVPETTFLVFSPGYSQPDRALFDDFAQQLSDKFKAELVRLPMPASEPAPGRLGRFLRRARHYLPDSVRDAKRNLVLGLRRRDTQYDLS
jgi:hypothetical protein